MFDALTVHGTAGTLLNGAARIAVEFSTWRITRTEGHWLLHATIARIDPFQARQRPLIFTAPRKAGWWAWPVQAIEIGETSLRANLGPPEQ